MSAITITISMRRPIVESHDSDGDATWHGDVVESTTRGLIPITAIGADGESRLMAAPHPRQIDRSRLLPILCRSMKALYCAVEGKA